MGSCEKCQSESDGIDGPGIGPRGQGAQWQSTGWPAPLSTLTRKGGEGPGGLKSAALKGRPGRDC